MREYELIVKTADDENAGTACEVWFKLEGTEGSTEWFHFDDQHGNPGRLFRPGLIASCVTETERPLGELMKCWVKLHPEDGEGPELLLATVEVIDGEQTHIWRFDEWICPGQPATAGPEQKL